MIFTYVAEAHGQPISPQWHIFLILLIYDVFIDFLCGLQGVADPLICTTHPYLLPNP